MIWAWSEIDCSEKSELKKRRANKLEQKEIRKENGMDDKLGCVFDK
ncbi:hypothetical protein GCM10027592_08270 [Spirosoma flavus]